MGDFIGLKAQGRYNGEPLTGTGKIGGVCWRCVAKERVSGTG
ncbi:hypothetical protein ACLK1S_21790 [Escherichia coli]